MSTDPQALEIHRSIHLGSKLGEGAMGLVLDAFAPDLGQHLAVKQLRPELADDPEARGRFKEEAEIMAKIAHPGVLPVYGLDVVGNRPPFYAMKKVEGKTLDQILADTREPATSLPRRNHLLRILLDACEAVASAHDKGVIHRDLKPENILVDDEGSVYVIDWGISKQSGSSSATQTLPGVIMGTPGYMSPEQAEGSSARAGTQSDVFALGVILYEILAGVRPFAAGSSRAEMLGAIHQEPRPLRRVHFLLPRPLCAVCHKALRKDPGGRYAGARGLADDLRAFLEGRPVTAVRPNLIERLAYGARRAPLRSLVMASVLAALLAVLAFIALHHLIDLRLAEKAMTRVDAIDLELAELKGQASRINSRLRSADLGAGERRQLTHELNVVDFRWILGQFEAFQLLRSVTELRFIRTDSRIEKMARKRQFEVIEIAIARERPAIAESLIATLLERHRDGELSRPLTPADLQLLEKLAAQAAGTPERPKN